MPEKVSTQTPSICVTCPICGRLLTEDFNRGAMMCGHCNRRWSISALIASLQGIVSLLTAEMN